MITINEKFTEKEHKKLRRIKDLTTKKEGRFISWHDFIIFTAEALQNRYDLEKTK